MELGFAKTLGVLAGASKVATTMYHIMIKI